MSDGLRSTTTTTASPRRSQTIARPDWPWASRAYSHRHSQASLTSSTSTPTPQVGWEPPARPSSGGTPSNGNNWRGTPTPKPGIQGMGSFRTQQGAESTQQWSLTGFEWAIKDIARLRSFVEGPIGQTDQGQATADDFELLKQSPILGDNKYKLEIALTNPSEGSGRPLLSLYITSLFLEYAQDDLETSATMMAAIKCQEDKTGERGARPEWIWEFWQHDWVFRRESEVWECPLPSLSELLDNQRIRDTDSFVICLQIHSPSGPSIPQQPSVCYVPRDLLSGLEASLDNANTGDVRFVCLERFNEAGELPASTSSVSGQGSSSSTSPHHTFSSHTTARKRTIYAHSDILIGRSEYFATMLSSSFSESATLSPGERKFHNIVVEEADFETIYWLLKFCYANWLLFKQDDDPRVAIEGVGAGRSAKWLNSRENEWDWKTFYKSSVDDSGVDSRSAASGDSVAFSGTISRATSRKSDAGDDATSPVTSGPRSTAKTPNTKTPSTSNPRQSVSAPRRSNTANTSSLGAGTAPIPKTVPVPVTTSSYSASRSYPLSPRAPRQMPPVVLDPHPHPTPQPPPASALAMYQVAHRYAMGGLAALALDHMLSTITPQSCFPLLLASYTWDELYSLVEDYIIEKWDDVSASEEFECCCKEIAAGEWGADGGQTLMSVFRRLRSPNSLST